MGHFTWRVLYVHTQGLRPTIKITYNYVQTMFTLKVLDEPSKSLVTMFKLQYAARERGHGQNQRSRRGDKLHEISRKHIVLSIIHDSLLYYIVALPRIQINTLSTPLLPQ